MALTEDADTLNIYLNDFGVSCQIAGGIVFKGILDKPTDVIGGGLATSVEYLLTSKTTDVTSASRGTAITVDSTSYTVRENLLIDDGSFTTLLLSKV
jgi:hypothetical protein